MAQAKPKPPSYLPLLLVAILATVFVFETFVYQVNVSYVGAADSVYAFQVMWNAAHGLPWVSTIYGGSWFMQHFKVMDLAISPILLVWPSFKAPLLLQSIFLAAGALVVYLLSRSYFPENDLLAIAAPLAYLLNPVIWASATQGYYGDTLAVPFFLAAWLFMRERKWKWFFTSIIGALLCYEWSGLTTAIIGCYLFVFKKERKVGAAAMLLGVLWLFASLSIIQLSNGSGYYYYTVSAVQNANGIGGFVQLALNGISFKSAAFLLEVLVPVGFLALLAPEVALCCGMLYIQLFAGWESDTISHLASLVAAFMVIASLEGISKFKGIQKPAAAWLLVFAVVSFALLVPLNSAGLLGQQNLGVFSPTPMDALSASIPQNASVSVDFYNGNLSVGALSLRDHVYMFPGPLTPSIYVDIFPKKLPEYLASSKVADYYLVNSTGLIDYNGKPIPIQSVVAFGPLVGAGWVREVSQEQGFTLFKTVNASAVEQYEDYESCIYKPTIDFNCATSLYYAALYSGQASACDVFESPISQECRVRVLNGTKIPAG